MASNYLTTLRTFCPGCVERFKSKQDEILNWLKQTEEGFRPPLYSSVDIRDAGFKIAVVDSNLFPAGFNNLCEHGLQDAVGFMKNAILARAKDCRDVLIVAEEHTRNTWYLENIRILQDIIQKAGFNVRIATFLTVQPGFCDSAKYVELETATGQSVRIHCFKRIIAEYKADRDNIDLIILNNDLTTGIPEILVKDNIPIYPSVFAGWHSRSKSEHFKYTEELISQFAKILNLDPWLFSTLFEKVENVDINVEVDRQRIMEVATNLFDKIKQKYQEHGIEAKPFIMLKDDAGTYGMGVIPIEDPKEILVLNRRARNNLSTGKSQRVINRLILQEGVPTITHVDEQVSEIVIYQIENHLIGGFYRFNSQKGDRENLNSPGMGFKKMCPHLPKYGDEGPHPDPNIFDIYRILARIAAIAVRMEVRDLKEKNK